MSRPELCDVVAASKAVAALWEALEADDDAALLDLSTASVRDEVGTDPEAARRLRAILDVDVPQAGGVIVLSRVHLVDGIELSPVIGPSEALALDMLDGRLEGIVLKDRESTYRDGRGQPGGRLFERQAWRIDRRCHHGERVA